MAGCLGITAFAGDTNFVASFKTMWQTHNASNILVFVEQNVATNKSPETLFARGIVSTALQFWNQGTTNYWEQSIQMIATNNAYSEISRTNIIKQIRFFQFAVSTMAEDTPQPSWNVNEQAVIFAELASEPFYFDVLKAISNMERVGN